jgi:hypothetical protein
MGYAGRMSFAKDDLELLAREPEIRIETQAPGKEARRTPIWVVVDDDEVFVRTWRGPGSRWFRDIEVNPAVAVHVGGKRLAATAIPATDPDSIERTNAGFRRKYAGDPAVKAMVDAKVLDTTLRLEPA